MAYQNSDGKIMIDEIAAQSDLNRLMRAADILRHVGQAFGVVISETGSFQGETAKAIMETAQSFQARAQQMVSALDESQAYIRRVVAYYREVDRKAREAISAAQTKGSD